MGADVIAWIGFLASAILAAPIYRLLLRLKSRQTIDPYAPETHQVKQGTPTMGGLIIIVGLVVSQFLGLFWYEGMGESAFSAMLILTAGFALIGFADDYLVPRLTDKRGLGWKQKIVPEVIFAVLGIGIWTGWRFETEFWGGVFLILFFANAYNFSDGLDGLAGSLLLGLSGGLYILALGTGRDALLPAAMFLCVIPFLSLNAPPAKVFMGDVGSLPIGALLGFVVLYLASASPLPQTIVPLSILSLMMVAELVPVPLQVFYYKLTKKRLFPMTPIHHGFEKMGWPESKVVWTFALMQILLSAIAVGIAMNWRTLFGPQPSVIIWGGN